MLKQPRRLKSSTRPSLVHPLKPSLTTRRTDQIPAINLNPSRSGKRQIQTTNRTLWCQRRRPRLGCSVGHPRQERYGSATAQPRRLSNVNQISRKSLTLQL
ncbi:hypothetical protein PM082_007571 [Marasmius tenuissimus]|nr:hypothetical protein PM082_007571 [Marasmius tenuissimus]